MAAGDCFQWVKAADGGGFEILCGAGGFKILDRGCSVDCKCVLEPRRRRVKFDLRM